MEAHQILLRPIMSERATEQAEQYNKYTFAVASKANKFQIRNAIEAFYGVNVTCVATLNMPVKTKRRGTVQGRSPGWKKAVITLQAGDAIDFFATE